MNDEALLLLALQACHDHTAQPVLGDAVIEAGWSDPRVLFLMRHQWYDRLRENEFPECRVHTRTVKRARNLSAKYAAKASRRWCRAVAAVMLFGGWTVHVWPFFYDAWNAWKLTTPVSGLDAWLPRMMDANMDAAGISQLPPLFGVNRTPSMMIMNPTDYAVLKQEIESTQSNLRVVLSQQIYGASPSQSGDDE